MTSNKKKLLILYASYGDGHIQVSQALKEQIEQSEEAYEAVLVDLFAEAYPFLNSITKYIYIKSYTLFPKLYGFSYYITKEMRNDTLFSSWFHSWGMSSLKEIIRREKPYAVVNTFPMLAMPELRRKTGVAVPIFNVITDYALHRRWIHPLIDRYYVAADDLKAEMEAAGVPGDRIVASGIPLKSRFQPLKRSLELYAKYGLDYAKQTVLIMAGSYGVLQGLAHVCAKLSALPAVQLMVVCGKNESLYAELKKSVASDNVHVVGFMQNMHELMSISDTMVTKPGGITLTESVQCELPVVLLRPVPGQELENANYFASHGAAFVAQTDEQLTAYIQSLLTDPKRRADAVEAMRSLKKPQSSATIVRDILAVAGSFPTKENNK